MRKLPNFVLLRTFEAAARLQSFTLAAEELHVTPSAISHQIKELEQHFQTPLFVRRNQRVRTTFEGQRLSQNLANIFSALEASCSEVTGVSQNHELNIHCPASLGLTWLAQRLPGFLRSNPELSVRISTTTENINLIEARAFDIEIRYGFIERHPGIAYYELGKEDIVPLCAPSLVDKDTDPFDLIASLPLIESRWSHFTWREWFVMNGLEQTPKMQYSFDRGAMAISAASLGVGVALESRRLAEQAIAAGTLVELGANVFQRASRLTHFLAQREYEHNVPKVQKFRTWLLAQAFEDDAEISVEKLVAREAPEAHREPINRSALPRHVRD